MRALVYERTCLFVASTKIRNAAMEKLEKEVAKARVMIVDFEILGKTLGQFW